MKLKWWDKLENLLNGMIESIILFIQKVLLSFTPRRLLDMLEKSEKNLNKNLSHFKAKLQAWKNSFNNKLSSLWTSLKYWPNKFLAFLGNLIESAKNFNIKTFSFKKLFILIGAFLAPYLAKLKKWFITLQPTTVLAMVMTSSLITLSGVSILYKGKSLVNKVQKSRAPASIGSSQMNAAKSVRPTYYKLDEKHFRLYNMEIPVYVGGSPSSIKSVKMDITVTSSNKYIRAYFNENIHLVRDRLNTNIHPIVPEFPLKAEGKAIILDKVKAEINSLIKEYKIEGSVKDVHLHSILGG